MRVEVYFNLHKKLFSVRALEGLNKGKVIDHAHEVHLDCPVFVVQEGGRQRVLKEKRKNVHAFVRGHLINPATYDPTGDGIGYVIPGIQDLVEITYNPYKFETFVGKASTLPVHTAMYAFLSGKQVWTTRDAFC